MLPVADDPFVTIGCFTVLRRLPGVGECVAVTTGVAGTQNGAGSPRCSHTHSRYIGRKMTDNPERGTVDVWLHHTHSDPSGARPQAAV